MSTPPKFAFVTPDGFPNQRWLTVDGQERPLSAENAKISMYNLAQRELLDLNISSNPYFNVVLQLSPDQAMVLAEALVFAANDIGARHDH